MRDLPEERSMYPGRKGVVTWGKKLRRVSVTWDDDGTCAQIRVRFLRKLHELEVLAEAAEQILGENP